MIQWCEVHANEFQLMCWPPKSLDHNPIGHIWYVMEFHLLSSPATSSYSMAIVLHMLANLVQSSLDTYQGLVKYMPRWVWVAAFLRVIGGAT